MDKTTGWIVLIYAFGQVYHHKMFKALFTVKFVLNFAILLSNFEFGPSPGSPALILAL